MSIDWGKIVSTIAPFLAQLVVLCALLYIILGISAVILPILIGIALIVWVVTHSDYYTLSKSEI